MYCKANLKRTICMRIAIVHSGSRIPCALHMGNFSTKQGVCGQVLIIKMPCAGYGIML